MYLVMCLWLRPRSTRASCARSTASSADPFRSRLTATRMGGVPAGAFEGTYSATSTVRIEGARRGGEKRRGEKEGGEQRAGEGRGERDEAEEREKGSREKNEKKKPTLSSNPSPNPLTRRERPGPDPLDDLQGARRDEGLVSHELLEGVELQRRGRRSRRPSSIDAGSFGRRWRPCR